MHREGSHAQPAHRSRSQSQIRRILLLAMPDALQLVLRKLWIGGNGEQVLAHIEIPRINQAILSNAQQSQRTRVGVDDALLLIEQHESAAHTRADLHEHMILACKACWYEIGLCV